MAFAVEKAYRAIRESILRKSHPPGTRLKEEHLAAEIGVSRTPVREALRRLHIEGWVEFVPNQGAFVPSWTAEEVEEIFTLRELLESYGASLAARRVTNEDIAKLLTVCDELDRVIEDAGPTLIETSCQLNEEFHRLIAQASGGTRLVSMICQVIELPLVMEALRHASMEEMRRNAQHHREIVRALEVGDPEWARAIMRTHILASFSHHRKVLRPTETRVETRRDVLTREPAGSIRSRSESMLGQQ
jgi:DNA-binding GntR family transcriptional regulator